jgi:hypothetical protein
LSALRDRIQEDIRSLLGISSNKFRLWQDKQAIASGKLWKSEIESAVAQSVFFIPIITPTSIKSKYCMYELELFKGRLKGLGQNDLVFPLVYYPVPELRDSNLPEAHPLLSLIASHQFVDWGEDFSLRSLDDFEVQKAIRKLTTNIADAIRRLQRREAQAREERLAAEAARAAEIARIAEKERLAAESARAAEIARIAEEERLASEAARAAEITAQTAGAEYPLRAPDDEVASKQQSEIVIPPPHAMSGAPSNASENRSISHRPFVFVILMAILGAGYYFYYTNKAYEQEAAQRATEAAAAQQRQAAPQPPTPPAPTTLLEFMSSGRWAISPESNCINPKKNYTLRLETPNLTGHAVWRDGSNNEDVETVEWNDPQKADTVTIKSAHPGGLPSKIGTTWNYTYVDPDHVQVRTSVGIHNFILVRCPQ